MIGAEVVLLTEATRSLIAPADKNWDFMLVNADYQTMVRHHKAALVASRLIEMDPS